MSSFSYPGSHEPLAHRQSLRHRVDVQAARLLEGCGAPALATTAALSITGGDALLTAGVTAGSFVAARLLVRPVDQHARQLPLMRHAAPMLGALIAVVALHVASVPLGPGLWHAGAGLLLFAAAMAGLVLFDEPLRAASPARRRIAVVGPDRTAVALRDELASAGVEGYELAGRVTVGPADPQNHVRALGSLDAMRDIVVEHRIDLLVLAPDVPRLPVFDEIAASCLELPVRLVDLDSFCERAFGHVPVTAINGAWFQYLMHPRFRRGGPPTKRAIDVAIALVAGLVFLPLMLVAALLIRRDGGPALFVQTRIGEGGRPFRIYKLRTMTVSDGPSVWTTGDDARVTRIGRLLRRTHLDEVPQLLNILLGDMSVVGPRPEQPTYVSALEQGIPYYSRRHLIKPGLTGWAQVRCGYAGSIEGSAWKMCHDLYYVKHRSLWLDLLILGETVRTLFADRQFPEGEVAVSAFSRPALAPAEGVALTS